MWISINDRVPDDSDPEVLLFIEDDYPNMFSGYFYEAVADHSVTHWMPLPSPPTAEIVEGANLQTHNIESAQCHHRFKQTPSATMVQCVDCGAKFDYNQRGDTAHISRDVGGNKFFSGDYMSQLKNEFFAETGVEWKNSQGEPDIDYVNWLEAKVEKFTSTNNARDEIAAAEKLCKIYFDIAASCIGEDAVRQRVAAATSPVA